MQLCLQPTVQTGVETISNHFKKEEIVKVHAYKEYSDEVMGCTQNIIEDINQGLLPDDILVVVVDDRHAKTYLDDIQRLLARAKIKSNNIHADKFSIKDFSIEGHVTLSTIHKAKGNEAYSVHVLGTDSLYSLEPTIRERNLMFTAITRTKGWVSISGVGNAAAKWKKEIQLALTKCPNIEFKYPSKNELSIMKRDIQEKATRKSKQAKILDELLAEMSPEEIKQFLAQREIKKKDSRDSN